MVEAFAGSTPARLTLIISRAQSYAPLEITRHTAAEYGELKANLAKLYIAKAFARDRPRWLENWVDQATGQRLQVDENDLWMCAQARERNLSCSQPTGKWTGSREPIRWCGYPSSKFSRPPKAAVVGRLRRFACGPANGGNRRNSSLPRVPAEVRL